MLHMDRKHLIFGVVSLALLMSSIDNTIVAVGLPAMQAGLHTTVLLIGWTITIYQLGQLLIMPLAGKLSDELGRKRVFLTAVTIFTASSFLCGFAPNVYLLVVFRLMQAVGGGAFLPSCTGIIADIFQDKRAQAIGLFSSIFPIGGIIGPNLGGVIIDHISWRFIFYVNVPLGLAVLVLTALLYRPGRQPSIRATIDFLGVGLYGTAIVLVLLGLTWLGDHPHDVLRAPLLWLAFAGAIGLFVIWYWHEKHTATPMVETVLLNYRPLLAANIYNFLYGAGVFGFTAFLPTYAELYYHMSATAAGALLTPRAVIMIVTSVLASFVIIRSGYWLPMIAGIILVSLSLIITSFGLVNVSLLGIHLSNFWYLAMVVSLLGLGFGISGPASSNAPIDVMPEKVAAITGIRGMFRQTGGVIGTATVVFVAALFADEAHGLEVVFFGMAFVVLTVIPTVFFIPDTPRLRRKAGQAPRPAAASAGERPALME
jgi:EmrB/QacA subfamily drug resistance transporter